MIMKLIILFLGIMVIAEMLLLKYFIKTTRSLQIEVNEEIDKNCIYKRALKNLKLVIRQFRGTQFYGNFSIGLRKLENDINQLENEMMKKELSNDLQENR